MDTVESQVALERRRGRSEGGGGGGRAIRPEGEEAACAEREETPRVE